jgi:hypothetical protein
VSEVNLKSFPAGKEAVMKRWTLALLVFFCYLVSVKPVLLCSEQKTFTVKLLSAPFGTGTYVLHSAESNRQIVHGIR